MSLIYSAWDGTLNGSVNIIENEMQEYLVKYPTSKSGVYFQLLFRVKKNPIGFITYR